MTLSDVLGRDLRVEWHEAVALMRDIVERSADESMPTVPELHQVELLAWGQVEVHDGVVVAQPVQRLGQMLQALLTRADPPVQLRLLIAQPQESVRAFSEALAFFERPDRIAILQALYNRASAALPLPDPDTLTVSSAAMRPPLGDDEPSGDRTSAPRRRLLYAAGVVTLILALGAALVFAGRTDGASPIARASGLKTRVSDGLTDVTRAVGSAVSSIGERVGLAGAAADAPTPVEVAKPPVPAVAPSRSKNSERSSAKSEVPTLQRGALSAFDLDQSIKATMPQAAPLDAPPSVQDVQVIIASEPQEEAIYSINSPGVSAPVGLRPQLPKELPAGVRPEDLTRIELVILPDGTVDSVKLIGQPRNVHEVMLLSAAKSWQFHPALKDGTPVRYRKTIWVTR